MKHKIHTLQSHRIELSGLDILQALRAWLTGIDIPEGALVRFYYGEDGFYYNINSDCPILVLYDRKIDKPDAT